jgi:hypothetical protein
MTKKRLTYKEIFNEQIIKYNLFFISAFDNCTLLFQAIIGISWFCGKSNNETEIQSSPIMIDISEKIAKW